MAAPVIFYTEVTHNGTVSTAYGPYTIGESVGPIYISDIKRRDDLGGILEVDGDDQYVNPLTTIYLVQTGQVMLSSSSGILHRWAALGVLSLTHNVTGVSGF